MASVEARKTDLREKILAMLRQKGPIDFGQLEKALTRGKVPPSGMAVLDETLALIDSGDAQLTTDRKIEAMTTAR